MVLFLSFSSTWYKSTGGDDTFLDMLEPEVSGVPVPPLEIETMYLLSVELASEIVSYYFIVEGRLIFTETHFDVV